MVDTAVHSLAAQVHQQIDSHKILSAQELIHRVGVGLGEGIGEGLAHSVARDPMKPLLFLVASIMGGLLLINGLVLLLLWRRYVHTNRSLMLFASQVIRSGTEPSLIQAIQADHVAVHHQGWLIRFLQNHGFIAPSLTSPQETPSENSSNVL